MDFEVIKYFELDYETRNERGLNFQCEIMGT